MINKNKKVITKENKWRNKNSRTIKIAPEYYRSYFITQKINYDPDEEHEAT